MKIIAKTLTLSAMVATVAISCGKPTSQILVDGSSTVYPITEAVAESYRSVENGVNVTVGTSGTGGGFKKFCNGETDISDASRPVKKTEIEACVKGNIEYMELPVAFDGLAVIVNPANTFIEQLNVDQLNHIFRYKNPAKTWKDVNPAWPDQEIKIFSPGQDSGTYDYFVETVVGKKGRIRSDSTFSEDDNVLVTGIAGNKSAIGFFGLAYYEENQDRLKIVPVVNPKSGKAVTPSIETVKGGTYSPLSRPLFIYVRKASAEKPEVAAFVNYYLDNASALSKDVGYVPLDPELLKVTKNNFENKVTGSLIHQKGGHKSLMEIFQN